MGGNITLDSAVIQAPGQRVDLSGVQAGTLGLKVQGNQLNLSVSATAGRSDVRLTNGSLVNVAAAGGGAINIAAHNLSITGTSLVQAGIRSSLGTVGQRAGDITLNATGAITVAGSYVQNIVGPRAIGQGGDVIIRAKSLTLTDGGELDVLTLGQGNAGKVFIQAQDAVFFYRR